MKAAFYISVAVLGILLALTIYWNSGFLIWFSIAVIIVIVVCVKTDKDLFPFLLQHSINALKRYPLIITLAVNVLLAIDLYPVIYMQYGPIKCEKFLNSNNSTRDAILARLAGDPSVPRLKCIELSDYNPHTKSEIECNDHLVEALVGECSANKEESIIAVAKRVVKDINAPLTNSTTCAQYAQKNYTTQSDFTKKIQTEWRKENPDMEIVSKSFEYTLCNERAGNAKFQPLYLAALNNNSETKSKYRERKEDERRARVTAGWEKFDNMSISEQQTYLCNLNDGHNSPHEWMRKDCENY